MKNSPQSLLPLLALILLPAIMFCSSGAVISKNSAPGADPSGKLVIIHPLLLAGGPSGVVTIDGKEKRKKTGKRTLSITLQEGRYDLYGMNDFRPTTTVNIDSRQPVYLVDGNDAESQRALQLVRSGSAPSENTVPKRKTKPARQRGGKTSGMANVVLVTPPAFFKGPIALLSVDGKLRKEKTGAELLGVTVKPGRYAIHSLASEKALATITLDSAELVYIVNRNSGLSQRQLGDLFFESGNLKGALALYRGALKTDPTMTDLYLTYAELALAAGDKAEAIPALQRVVAAGLADGRTCQELGDLLAAAGRNDEARLVYEKALAIAGENPVVLAALARMRVKTGDLQGALAAYGQAIRLLPDSAYLYKAVGELHLKQKDTLKTIASYKMYFEKGGRNSSTVLFIGRYEYECRNSGDAVRYLAMVTGRQAEKVHYLRMLGESYFRSGNFSKAYATLRKAANKYPRSSEMPAVVELLIESNLALKDYKKAAYWVGVYAKTNKGQSASAAYYRAFLTERTSPAAARSLYEKNTVKFPGDYRNFLRCGLLLAADKSSRSPALSMIKKATSLADTVPDAWMEISRAYRKLERYDDELQALQVFATTHEQHAEAIARIGELMLKNGDAGAAILKLQTAEQSPAVLKALAMGYAQTGNIDKAIETLDRAKQVALNDTSIRLHLVELYRRKGQSEKVLEEYKGIVELRRDNATLFAYAKLLYENGRQEEAAGAIEDIRATQPDHVESLMLLGTVLRAQQKFTEAIKVYEEIVFIDPANVRALFERAETHLANSQPSWAESFYNRTLKRDPNYAPAVLGLAKVAKLQRRRDAYKLHLNRAYKLAPNDSAIRQEREESLRNEW